MSATLRYFYDKLLVNKKLVPFPATFHNYYRTGLFATTLNHTRLAQ